MLLDTAGPVALLEGVCRFVPSLLRIDPSAVAPPPGADDAAVSATPRTSEDKQSSSNNSNSSNRSNSRGGDGVFKLEWREFTSLAAAAGLPSVTPAEGKAEGKGESDGEDESVVEASTSKPSKPEAEGVDTRQPRPLAGVTISISGSGSGGVEAGAETETIVDRVNVSGERGGDGT